MFAPGSGQVHHFMTSGLHTRDCLVTSSRYTCFILLFTLLFYVCVRTLRAWAGFRGRGGRELGRVL